MVNAEATARKATSESGTLVKTSDSVSQAGDLAGDARRSRRARSRERTLVVWLLRLGVLVVWLGAWQLSVTYKLVDPLFAGEPSRIAVELWKGAFGAGHPYLSLAETTLFEMVGGFASGMAVGVALAFLLAQSEIARRVADPFIVAFNATPRIALAPLFLLWFGFGPLSRIALAFSLVFFIALVNTLAGVESADPEHLRLASVLGVGRLAQFRDFLMPAALPAIFAATQLGLVYALLAAVVGEMLQGSAGLGGAMAEASNTLNTDAFFAMLAFLICFGVLLSQGFSGLERRLLRWKYVGT